MKNGETGMANKKNLALSIKIILVIAVIFITVFTLMNFILTGQIRSGIFQSEKQNLIMACRQFSSSIENVIFGIEKIVKLNAKNKYLIEDIAKQDEESLLDLLKESYNSEPFFENCMICNADKKIVASYPMQDVKGKDAAAYLFWNGLKLERNSSYIDKRAYRSPLSGNPILTISTPIYDNDLLLGIWIVAIDLKKFSEILISTTKTANGGYSYIEDINGIFIGHPDTNLILSDYSGQTFVKSVIDSNNKSDFLKYYWEADKKYKYQAFKKSDSLPWIMVSTIYEEQLLSLAAKLRLNILIIEVISVIAIIIILVISTYYIITKPVNKITNDLKASSSNLRSASQQISSSTQQLASGSSELASSVEEITASLEELQSVVEANTTNINLSESMMQENSRETKGLMEKSDHLKLSLKEINENNKKVSKIIKVIEDIAFQTNILALNAAVEAARAGSAGKSFSIVADQVKNLAQKSSQAAKETAELIEKALESTIKVDQFGNEVIEVQIKVKEKTEKTAILLNEINAASKEQMKGLTQITQAITQINGVVQQTATSAEENAAASEELSSQAENLNEIVRLLNLLVKGKNDDNH